MKVKAEVSIYPLHHSDLTGLIQQFVEVLKNNKLQVRVGPMSSLVEGDSKVVFQSLQDGFEQLAAEYEVVLIAKISNAYP